MITGTCYQHFKDLPCFGVKFSNIHPASELGFLSEFFGGGGGGELLQGKARSQPNNVSKHRKELFYRHVAPLFK